MDPTPSPRPAALVATMRAAVTAVMFPGGYPAGLPWRCVEAALDAIAKSDHVIIPRAELEATAKWLEQMATGLFNFDRKSADDIANRLRQRSRG